MRKGNGNIRSFIGGVLVVIVCILAISEYAVGCDRPVDWGTIDPWPYKENK